MNDRSSAERWFFDAWSLFYDLPIAQRLTYRPVHDAVLRDLCGAVPRTLLDLGCGTGLLAERIHRELPQTRIVGCDFSHGMLRQAAEHRGACARWTQADAMRLPFPESCFDAIVSTESFHWFPDQAAALLECFRVLVPAGRLLVALVNPPIEALSDAMRLGSRIVGEPFYWPTRQRMRALLERAGFRVDAQHRLYRVPAGLLLPRLLLTRLRPARLWLARLGARRRLIAAARGAGTEVHRRLAFAAALVRARRAEVLGAGLVTRTVMFV